MVRDEDFRNPGIRQHLGPSRGSACSEICFFDDKSTRCADRRVDAPTGRRLIILVDENVLETSIRAYIRQRTGRLGERRLWRKHYTDKTYHTNGSTHARGSAITG